MFLLEFSRGTYRVSPVSDYSDAKAHCATNRSTLCAVYPSEDAANRALEKLAKAPSARVPAPRGGDVA